MENLTDEKQIAKRDQLIDRILYNLGNYCEYLQEEAEVEMGGSKSFKLINDYTDVLCTNELSYGLPVVKSLDKWLKENYTLQELKQIVKTCGECDKKPITIDKLKDFEYAEYPLNNNPNETIYVFDEIAFKGRIGWLEMLDYVKNYQKENE